MKRGAPKVKKVYRQDSWQRRQYELGNCIWCGQPRGDSPFKRLCHRHGLIDRLRARRTKGGKPWRRNGGGQPPIDIPVNDSYDVDKLYPALPPRNGRKRGKSSGSIPGNTKQNVAVDPVESGLFAVDR